MKFWLLIAALAATCPALAQETSEAILGYDPDGSSGYFSSTVGWAFQTTTALTVTELGCFADVFANNPAVSAIQIGLWASDGALLASNSITPSSTLFDQTRYESITPVSLNPGQTYYLGAYYSGGYLGFDVAAPSLGGSVSASPQIQLDGTALSTSGFTFPAEQAGTAGSIYAGPNFQFQSQPKLAIQLWPTNQARLSWSTLYPGYTLQAKPGLFGTWTNTGLAVTVVSNAYVAFDTLGPGPKYYRLFQ
jgi:hypothetical protein